VVKKGEPQTRREFCARSCHVASVMSLGGAAAVLQGCGGGGSPTSASPGLTLPVVSGGISGSTVAVAIAGTALDSTGALALVRTSAGDLLVARTSADTFMALGATCTHERCEVSGYEGQTFVCPCHGSRFDTSGRVVQGPATRALPSFPTRFGDGVLTIAT